MYTEVTASTFVFCVPCLMDLCSVVLNKRDIIAWHNDANPCIVLYNSGEFVDQLSVK